MGNAIRIGAAIFIVAVFVVTFLLARRTYRAAAPRLGLMNRLRYRGRTVGIIERLEPDEVEVSYQVDGCAYTLTAPVAPFRGTIIETSPYSHGDISGLPTGSFHYLTTTLGDLSEGGEITVRYDRAHPDRAVPAPNGVTFRPDPTDNA